MEKENNKYEPAAVDFNNILSVFKKRKWWFIGSFIVLLLVGLAYSFFIARDYQYRASTVITIPADNLLYENRISDEYPEKANPLWLFKEGKPTNNYYNLHLKAMIMEINSDEFLGIINNNLDINLNPKLLKKLILTDHKPNEHFFILNTFYSNPDVAAKLSEQILFDYIDYRQKKFKPVYDELVHIVKEDISILEEELNHLSSEAEGYISAFIENLIKDLPAGKEINIELKSSDFLPPELSSRINTVAARYDYLKDILNNLEKNEKHYTGSISIVSDTGTVVEENFTLFRNLLISIFAALIISTIFIYIVDYIISVKNKKRLFNRL